MFEDILQSINVPVYKCVNHATFQVKTADYLIIPEARMFHGEVINLRDVITFEADCVDDYLEFCNERGVNPERPFSGKFVLRVDCELHKEIFIKSQLAKKSINSWITEALELAVIGDTQRMHSHKSA